MSLTTALISELVWAANQVEHLNDFEKRRLLERAVVTIREMRDQLGIPENKTEAHPVIDLQTTAEVQASLRLLYDKIEPFDLGFRVKYAPWQRHNCRSN